MKKQFVNLEKIIKIEDENSSWFVEIDKNLEFFLENGELPLWVTFFNTYTDEKIWEIETFPGNWVTFPQMRGTKVTITNSNGDILAEKNWDRNKYEDLIETVLRLSIKKYNLLKGLIVGSGHGDYGEWIDIVKNNQTSCVLVEPDEESFEKLYSRYSKYSNIKFEKVAVDIRKGIKKFWLAPQKNVSSLKIENCLNYNFQKNELVEVEVETESLKNLIDKHNVDWVRLDAEGMDYDLVMSLESETFDKLKYIQYEHINISDNDKNNLNFFLESNGYVVFFVNIDCVAIKK